MGGRCETLQLGAVVALARPLGSDRGSAPRQPVLPLGRSARLITQITYRVFLWVAYVRVRLHFERVFWGHIVKKALIWLGKLSPDEITELAVRETVIDVSDFWLSHACKTRLGAAAVAVHLNLMVQGAMKLERLAAHEWLTKRATRARDREAAHGR